MNLSAWLRKTPQPHFVRLDGDKKIEVPHGKGSKWRDVIRTIEALGGSKVEALDAQGSIIRATQLDEDEPEKKGETPLAVCETCGGSLNHFASLLADGYEKGAKGGEPLLMRAMEFIERQAQRLSAADREIDKLRAINARQTAEIMMLKNAPAGASDEGGVMQAMLAGVLQAAAGTPMLAVEQPVPNGKGPRK